MEKKKKGSQEQKKTDEKDQKVSPSYTVSFTTAVQVYGVPPVHLQYF